MFGTIRKHQTWLWAVIITLTIISFVVFFSPYSKMNSGSRGRENYGSINGEKISRQQFANSYREVDLHYFLIANPGHWLGEDKRRSEQELDRDIYNWLLLVQKQQQQGIHASDEAAAEMARRLIRPFERMGVTSPAMFIQKVLEPHGLQVADFERYVQHFLGLQELINIFGLSGGLVTPQEAKSLYERDHQEIAADAVFFSASNYLAEVSASPEAVAQFYSNRIATYMIPDRVQVSYVEFPVTNWLAKAQTDLGTNLNELVEANYDRLGTNLSALFPDAKTPEEYKTRIRERVIRDKALSDARNQANDFAHAVIDNPAAGGAGFEEMAKTNGLTIRVTAPFDREEGPKDLEVGPDFVKAAFSLNPQEPVAGPLVGPDAVYVIAFNKQIPHETPPLEQVRDKVTADYKHAQAMALARQAGTGFYQTLTNGLAQGGNFTNLCAAAKLIPVGLPPFSISSREFPTNVENLVSLNQLKQAAFSTAPGKASAFQPTSQGGMLLYVKAKLPINATKMETDLPGYVLNLRATRQQEAFNDWLRKEAEKGLRDTPVGRPQPPPTMGTPAKT